MANIPVDPNTLEAPDFALEHYAESRQPLVEAGLTEEQAIAVLTRTWTAGNERDKQAWQERTNAEAQATRDQALAAEEAANQRRELDKQEAEQARKDELKKNRDKYVPIPDRPPPSGSLVLAAPYATRRLEKGQYIELYYYTNQGLLAAAAAVTQVDDEALAMRTNSDGTTSWVPAASLRSAKAVIPDSELTWEQFREAVPRLIVAMQQAKWAEERVLMLAKFWGNLQVHPFQQSCDALDTRTLIAYQAEQRQRWHQAIHAPDGAWNISILSETILRETRDRVYRKERAAKDAENYVSTPLPFGRVEY